MTTVALTGVHQQLEEAHEALALSGEHARRGEYDPAYRAALKSRNLLFHAVRGVQAAAGQELSAMPVVAGNKLGSIADFDVAMEQMEVARGAGDDLVAIGAALATTYPPYSRYLAWLREEVGRLLRGA